MRTIPAQLHGRPFRRAEALALGVTPNQLRGPGFARIHDGIYRTSSTEPNFSLLIAAAQLVLPGDAAISHITNLRLRGLSIGPEYPLHFASNGRHPRRRDGIVLHRHQAEVLVETVHDTPCVDAYRTFIDCGTVMGWRTLVTVGDWLVTRGLVTVERLIDYTAAVHFDGVQRARRAVAWVRSGSESPRESDLRVVLISDGLPEPELNVDIVDENGHWLARGDLVYRRWKVLVEYDGWQHERDARQRQHDHLRREELDAAGWRVIVVTTMDMQYPARIANRVRDALRQRGCPC